MSVSVYVQSPIQSPIQSPTYSPWPYILLDVPLTPRIQNAGMAPKIFVYIVCFLLSWTPLICGICVIVYTHENHKSNILIFGIIGIVAEVIKRICIAMGATWSEQQRDEKAEKRHQVRHEELVAVIQTHGIVVNDQILKDSMTLLQQNLVDGFKKQVRSDMITAIDQSFDKGIQKYDTTLRYDLLDHATSSELHPGTDIRGSE